MWQIELAGAAAFLAPGFDEAAVLRVLHDAGVHMAVRHKDVTVGRDRDVRGTVERVRPIPGHTLRADGHQELVVAAELVDQLAVRAFLVVLAVGHPEIAVAAYANAMGPDEHLVPPGTQHLAVRIEFDHRRLSAREGEDDAFRINGHPGGLTPFHAVRQLLPPTGNGLVHVLRDQAGGPHQKSEERDRNDQRKRVATAERTHCGSLLVAKYTPRLHSRLQRES